MTTHTVRSPEDILDAFRALVTEAEEVIGSSLGENSAEVLDALRRRAQAVEVRLAAMYAGTRRQVLAGHGAIHRHPYPALALAASAGLLLGLALGSRRHASPQPAG